MIGVLVAFPGDDSAVVAALDTPAFTVVRRCADVAELLGAAEAGLGDVAVVSADLANVDRDTVARLRAAGVRTVALAELDWQRQRMLVIGVDAAVATPAELPGTLAVWTGREVSAEPVPPEPAPDARDEREPGRLIAVWGPAGAPGRTTVAINLAAELASRGNDVLLVDADTYGGAVAQSLGMLDEAPGLAAACRSAATGELDAARIVRLAPAVAERLRVLTGITRPSRWPEISRASLDDVWRAARLAADIVVVDTGFSLEMDEAISYDTLAPQRNAATLSALAAADEAIVVGRADVVGLARLLRVLADEDDRAMMPSALRVVVNCARKALGGDDVAEAAARYGAVDVAVRIPFDEAVEKARFLGVTLAEISPPPPALVAIRAIADLVAPASARRSRRTRRAD